MDKFEKEYFESLRKNAKHFEGNLHQIAKERLKMFAATIARLVLDEKETFDLITGPGNSGIYMTSLTKMIYEELGIKCPPILNIPITRELEGSELVGMRYPEKVEVPKEVKNVLFVDDEIMRGGTAKASFDLILKSQSNKSKLAAVIVAENHFFEWHYKTPEVSVRFYAYSLLIQWINGIMGHLLSDELFKELDVIPEIETYNDCLAVVLGGAIKIDAKVPYYDYSAEQTMREKVKGYEMKKAELVDEIKSLIKQGIEGYNSGEIKFRF